MFVSEVEFMLHKKQLNRILEIDRLKLKILEKELEIHRIDARIQQYNNRGYTGRNKKRSHYAKA